MDDIICKYLNKSKDSLLTIIINLEKNLEFSDTILWKNENKQDIFSKIINIYYDKYYLYSNNDFSKIDNYIKFNSGINVKLKTILLSIIEYYENNNEENIIKENENCVLYLTILIYISIILYESDFKAIDNDKSIEKVINNVIDNFQNIRFNNNKDLSALISNIEDIIKKNNLFNYYIDRLSDKSSSNYFLRINKNSNYYKVFYEYSIDKLTDYEKKDINIVNKSMNMKLEFTKISYDLAYYTLFKLLKKGKDIVLLFPIKKDTLSMEFIENYITIRDKNIINRLKFIVDFNDIVGNYDFINFIRENNIDLFIEIKDNFQTNNYNMFMDVKNIIVEEEFISINDKYVQIWDDMGINFIIKNYGNKINENILLSRK